MAAPSTVMARRVTENFFISRLLWLVLHLQQVPLLFLLWITASYKLG